MTSCARTHPRKAGHRGTTHDRLRPTTCAWRGSPSIPWKVLGASLVILFGSFQFARRLKQAFFPKDNSYLRTRRVAAEGRADERHHGRSRATRIDGDPEAALDDWNKSHPARDKKPSLKPSPPSSAVAVPGVMVSRSRQRWPAGRNRAARGGCERKAVTNEIIETSQRRCREITRRASDVRQLGTEARRDPWRFDQGEDISVVARHRREGEGHPAVRAPLTETSARSWGADSFGDEASGGDRCRANLAGSRISIVADVLGGVGSAARFVGQLREEDRPNFPIGRASAARAAAALDRKTFKCARVRRVSECPLAADLPGKKNVVTR